MEVINNIKSITQVSVEILENKAGIVVVLFIIIAYLIIKKMNQTHEIKVIRELKKQKPKKIKDQAKYRKASIEKQLKRICEYLDQAIKMLFTVFWS